MLCSMHKRGLCRYAVSDCVCVSVCYVLNSVKTNKVSSIFFHRLVAKPF